VDHHRLLPPGSGAGFVGDLAIPADFYWVTRQPAPLAGMGYPRGNSWEALLHAGIQHVVCLTHATAPYDSSPLETHHAQMQDMYNRAMPDDPERERALALDAARFVVERLQAGEGVVVHCHAGRGRTGTVIGSALVMLGHDPETVVDWLHRVQRTRGKRGWPEQPWQAGVVLDP
jgi:protein-tyrosine phosphatase